MKNRIISLTLIASIMLSLLAFAGVNSTAATNNVLLKMGSDLWHLEYDFIADGHYAIQVVGNKMRYDLYEYDSGPFTSYENYSIVDNNTIVIIFNSTEKLYIYSSNSNNMLNWEFVYNNYSSGGVLFKESTSVFEFKTSSFPEGRFVSEFFSDLDSTSYIDTYKNGLIRIRYNNGTNSINLNCNNQVAKNIYRINAYYDSSDYLHGIFTEFANSKRVYASMFTRDGIINDKWTKIFPDIKPGDWYYDAVTYVNNKGYMSGYSNGKFGTVDNIQRQDFVVILAKAAGVDLSKYVNVNSNLSDVKKGQYYTSAINWAVANGIVSGYQNGKFGIGDKITREQVATMFYQYMKKPSVSNVDSTLSKFSDSAKISSYARTALAWAVQKKIISGMADGRIAAKEGASRAQIAVIICNMDKQGMFKK